MHALGGVVAPGGQREYGSATVEIKRATRLLPQGSYPVWMSHGDRVETLPDGFKATASSDGSPFAAAEDEAQRLYCLQFHPEVQHTPVGRQVLKNFALDICCAKADWTPESIVEESVSHIREQAGDQRVLAAVSGGVDSSVAAALVHRAIGRQLSAVFVDNGLLRAGERESVIKAMKARLGDAFYFVDASQNFLDALKGVSDPEKKRLIVGETFIRVFEAKAKELGKMDLLMQGTIYPDVIESRAPERSAAHKIKSHHNVGGLPEEMNLKLVEPLRYLFKDEVRAVGTLLGLPDELVWRQPFPGPGLAVRCLGEVTDQRLEKLRKADAIFIGELRSRLLDRTAQPKGRLDRAGFRGAAAGEVGGGDGRPAHLPGNDRAARGQQPGFHDGGLGAAAARTAGTGLGPDRQ